MGPTTGAKMRIVVALGGSALEKRGEVLTAEARHASIKLAAASLAQLLAMGHEVVITHGDGPQVDYLSLHTGRCPRDGARGQARGIIGDVLQHELNKAFAPGKRYATLLTQIEVDPMDPALQTPTKFVGPVYTREEATRLNGHQGWTIARDDTCFRRKVPAPLPKRILELDVIRMLLEQDMVVICPGVGGIPLVQQSDGRMAGIEAVIDHDQSSGLLARHLQADALLMLTDVAGVFRDWGTPDQALIPHTTPQALQGASLPPDTMGTKVTAACEFVEATGGFAAIGRLVDALYLMDVTAGTRITSMV
jgi:carbamate kinase